MYFFTFFKNSSMVARSIFYIETQNNVPFCTPWFTNIKTMLGFRFCASFCFPVEPHNVLSQRFPQSLLNFLHIYLHFGTSLASGKGRVKFLSQISPISLWSLLEVIGGTLVILVWGIMGMLCIFANYLLSIW